MADQLPDYVMRALIDDRMAQLQADKDTELEEYQRRYRHRFISSSTWPNWRHASKRTRKRRVRISASSCTTKSRQTPADDASHSDASRSVNCSTVAGDWSAMSDPLSMTPNEASKKLIAASQTLWALIGDLDELERAHLKAKRIFDESYALAFRTAEGPWINASSQRQSKPCSSASKWTPPSLIYGASKTKSAGPRKAWTCGEPLPHPSDPNGHQPQRRGMTWHYRESNQKATSSQIQN